MKAHGVRGEVIVAPTTDDPKRFRPGSRLLCGRSADEMEEVSIEASRPHQGRLIVQVEGVADRGAADRLRGSLLFVEASSLASTPAEGWWEKDLIGCAVEDVSGAGLGTLSEVLGGPVQDLWKVATAAGDVLVPAVARFVISVDVDAKKIVLDPPKGLFEQ